MDSANRHPWNRSGASLANEMRMAQGNFKPLGLVVQNTRTGAIGTIVADRPQWSHRPATLLTSGAKNMTIAVQDHDTNVTRKWDCRRLVLI